MTLLRFLFFVCISALIVSEGNTEYYSGNWNSNDLLLSDTKWLHSTVELEGHRYASEDLAFRVHEQNSKWHLTPWMAIKTRNVDGVETEDCPAGNSLDEFPDGFLTESQRKNGGFLLHILGGIYSFTLLAVVCNDYFIPSVECICESLKIPKNIAAATFMAVATSFPEFFVNVISTFITESDLGIGTIVGSALFNCLGVAAVGGLAAIYPIAIDPRPLTRDCIIYAMNVAVLIGIVWDGRIYWYETLILMVLYITYFVFIFNSTRLFEKVDNYIDRRAARKNSPNLEISEDGEKKSGAFNNGFVDDSGNETAVNGKKTDIEKMAEININGEQVIVSDDSPKVRKSLWRYPSDKSVARRIWWVYTWPLKLVLTVTVPSPKTYPRLYALTFFLCIVWIGLNSYFVSWMITIIGVTFGISESVMGMTFLAFGGCLPEACSIFIMSRKGEGGMGVSNSLGANTLAILFSLGIPWFIKTVIMEASGEEGFISVDSGGIEYIIMSLLVAVATLWVILRIGNFFLKKSTGIAVLIAYVIFIVFAVLMELGYIFDLGRVEC